MSAPTAQTRKLATALREVLDLPDGETGKDLARRERITRSRVSRILGALDYLLDEERADITVALRSIGEIAERDPVDYTVRQGSVEAV
ncbi:hypothetical protein OHR68_10070 [Spirillospora sp. NBC_00431]